RIARPTTSCWFRVLARSACAAIAVRPARPALPLPPRSPARCSCAWSATLKRPPVRQLPTAHRPFMIIAALLRASVGIFVFLILQVVGIAHSGSESYESFSFGRGFAQAQRRLAL